MPPLCSLNACFFFFFLLLPFSHSQRPFLLVITNDDFNDPSSSSSADQNADTATDSSADWEDFGNPKSTSNHDYDPGSWLHILEFSSLPSSNSSDDPRNSLYFSGVREMINAASLGDPSAMESAYQRFLSVVVLLRWRRDWELRDGVVMGDFAMKSCSGDASSVSLVRSAAMIDECRWIEGERGN